jgi:hypothetical protein
MSVYYLIIRAKPTACNPDVDKLEIGMARFWVQDKSPEDAIDRAKHYLTRYDWTFESLAQKPIETVANDYPQSEDIPDVINFRKAQSFKVALHLVAWAKPGVMEPGTIEVRPLGGPCAGCLSYGTSSFS